MVTSNTTNFAPALADVIITAYGRCQIRRNALSPEHLHDAAMEANLLQSEWANDQVNLWTVDLATINLNPGIAIYDVEPSTIMIMAAYISTGSAPEKDRILTSMDRDTYAMFPNKESQGTPSVYWFDQQREPRITLWEVPDDAEPRQLKFYRARQMHDAVLPDGIEPDVPYSFLDAYVSGLAYRLSLHWTPAASAGLKTIADAAFKKAKERDVEKSSLRIVPAMSIYTNAVY